MSIKIGQVKRYVEQNLKNDQINKILNYVVKREPKLWGEQKGSRNFVQNMVFLTIYKDLYNVGFVRLSNQLEDINLYDKTLRFNVQKIRKYLAKWAKKKFNIGDAFLWDKSMRKRKLGSKIKQANLIVDSADFRLSGKSSTSTKDSTWSYKEVGPAQRYMIFYDGKGVVRKLLGGYSPKTYDSDLLKIQKEYLEDEIADGVVVGDQHFSKANEYIENFEFYCPYPEKNNKRRRDGKRVSKLTNAQQQWNKQIYDLRSSVETPFGNIKQKFLSLSCFKESKQQQDYLITFSLGLLNDNKIN